MEVCHGSVGQSVHTKNYMWVGPTLVAMATTFGLGAESSRLPACLCVATRLRCGEHFIGNLALSVQLCSERILKES